MTTCRNGHTIPEGRLACLQCAEEGALRFLRRAQQPHLDNILAGRTNLLLIHKASEGLHSHLIMFGSGYGMAWCGYQVRGGGYRRSQCSLAETDRREICPHCRVAFDLAMEQHLMTQE